MSDYDLSIHSNQDALAWAKFFMQTWEKLGRLEPDEAWMHSWFANAMMAVYDVERKKSDEAIRLAHIAGLREAAEMLCKRAEIKREQADRAFEADDEADQHGYSHAAFCLQQEADAILARIAELEKP